jgi:hypothetical protein
MGMAMLPKTPSVSLHCILQSFVIGLMPFAFHLMDISESIHLVDVLL